MTSKITDFAHGLRNGKGRYQYPDGSVYEGEYKNDKKHGKGKFLYSNGDTYEGSYKVSHPAIVLLSK